VALPYDALSATLFTHSGSTHLTVVEVAHFLIIKVCNLVLHALELLLPSELSGQGNPRTSKSQ